MTRKSLLLQIGEAFSFFFASTAAATGIFCVGERLSRTIEVNLNQEMNQEMTSRSYWCLEMAKVSLKSARELSFQHILDVFVAFSVQDV